MEKVAWFVSEAHNAHSLGALQTLFGYAMALSEDISGDGRDALLKPLIPIITGTRHSLSVMIKRAELLIFWTPQQVLPIALRAFNISEHFHAAITAQCESIENAGGAKWISANFRQRSVYQASNVYEAAYLCDLILEPQFSEKHTKVRGFVNDAGNSVVLTGVRFSKPPPKAQNENFSKAIDGPWKAILIGPLDRVKRGNGLDDRRRALAALPAPVQERRFPWRGLADLIPKRRAFELS